MRRSNAPSGPMCTGSPQRRTLSAASSDVLEDQLVALPFAVALAIDHHARRVGVHALQDAIEEELEVAEASGRVCRSGGRVRRWRCAATAHRPCDTLDLGLQPEAIEHFLQYFLGIDGWNGRGRGRYGGRSRCLHVGSCVVGAFGCVPPEAGASYDAGSCQISSESSKSHFPFPAGNAGRRGRRVAAVAGSTIAGRWTAIVARSSTGTGPTGR